MLVKSVVSNIIINESYNLNKYTEYEHFWKLFEVGCSHLHSVITLYRLDRNEKLLEIFAYPINNRAFNGWNWISKTVNWISNRGIQLYTSQK